MKFKTRIFTLFCLLLLVTSFVFTIFPSEAFAAKSLIEISVSSKCISYPSSSAGTHEAGIKATDGTTDTKWYTSEAKGTFIFDAGTVCHLHHMHLYSGNDNSTFPGRTPRYVYIYGSNDNKNWTSVGTFYPSQTSNNKNLWYNTGDISSYNAKYRYWKVEFNGSYGSGIQISELDLWAYPMHDVSVQDRISGTTTNLGSARTYQIYDNDSYTARSLGTTSYTGYTYSSTDSFTGSSSNGTKYNYFTRNQYTIKFNGNGGTTSDSKTSYTSSSLSYDVSAFLPANLFTRPGYTFVGWSTNSSATSATYSNGATVKNLSSTNGATVNLYAVWKANSYTIKYDSNGGTGAISSTVTKYDTALNLTANTFKKTGYDFVGWSTTSSAIASECAIKTSVSDISEFTDSVIVSNKGAVKNLNTSGEITLYAVWKQHEYQVFFNGNGATDLIDKDEQPNCYYRTYGEEEDYLTRGCSQATLPAIMYYREGYIFDGWKVSSSKLANDATLITTNSAVDVTYYAKWLEIEYSIAYELNNPYGEEEETSKAAILKTNDDIADSYKVRKYSQTVALPLTADDLYSVEGYKFDGWSSTEGALNSGNKTLIIGPTIAAEQNQHLPAEDRTYYTTAYAIWAKKTLADLDEDKLSLENASNNIITGSGATANTVSVQSNDDISDLCEAISHHDEICSVDERIQDAIFDDYNIPDLLTMDEYNKCKESDITASALVYFAVSDIVHTLEDSVSKAAFTLEPVADVIVKIGDNDVLELATGHAVTFTKGADLKIRIQLPDSFTENDSDILIVHNVSTNEDIQASLVYDNGEYWAEFVTDDFGSFEIRSYRAPSADYSSLTLAEGIKVNFYIDLSYHTETTSTAIIGLETYDSSNNYQLVTYAATSFDTSDIESTTVEYEISGKTDKVVYKTNLYFISYEMLPDQIAEPISIYIWDNEEDYINGINYGEEIIDDYTIEKYCLNVIDSGSADEDLVDLCKKIINYGGYSQAYFSSRITRVVNKGLSYERDVDIVNETDLSDFEKISNDSSLSNVTYYGSSFLALSNTSLRHYITIKSNKKLVLGKLGTDYNIKILRSTDGAVGVYNSDGTEYTSGDDKYELIYTKSKDSSEVSYYGENPITVYYGHNSNRDYIDIYGIVSKKLGEKYVVIIDNDDNADNGRLIIEYSPMTYVHSYINAENSDLKNLCRALYQYYQSAVSYFSNK